MAAPVWRVIGRLRREVTRLPGISVISSRPESGGKGAAFAGVSKTLVSFPIKVSDFREWAAGENPAEVGGLVTEPDGNVRRESLVGPENSDAEPRPQEDSSSSSSSDSDSDEEEPAGIRREKDPTSGKSAPGYQNTQREKPMAQELEGGELRPTQETGKQEGGDLVGAALAVGTTEPLQSSVKVKPRGCRDLAEEEKGEDLVDVAPPIASEEPIQRSVAQPPEQAKVLQKSSQDLSGEDRGEDLVDVAPEITPRGGQTLTGEEKGEDLVDLSPEITSRRGQTLAGEEKGEDLVDVAPETRPREGQTLAGEEKGEDLVDLAPEMTPRGGQTLAGEEKGEDLVDVAPALDQEEPIQKSEATTLSQVEEATSCQDVTWETAAASNGGKGPPGELSVASEEPKSSFPSDLSAAACEEIPQGEEPAASLTPPPPTPEEPFDNSKYQNEQHFSYTPFTFVDYDLELAKFRLPQPSSGRPSPRH